ncbi:MAG: acyl-CoA dehydrogenase, partial [bacterium]
DSKRFFTMIGTLVGGRVSVASASVTAMKTALTIATRYGARRRQFGPSGEPEQAILDYRNHKRRLLPRIAEAYGLHFATRHLRKRYKNRSEEDKREVEALAAGLKAHASWRAIDAIQESREACGGEGYMTRNRISELRKDVDIYATFEGDNTVLMMLLARGLLNKFRKQFEDNKFFSIVSYIADQAATTITELNPVTTRNTDEEHLRSEDFHRSAFEFRENYLMRTSAQRIKKRIDDGMDPFEAFSEIQDHLLSLSEAHVERTVLQQFLEAEERCDRQEFKPWLRSLRQLYALERIHDDVGWFLENGYVESSKTKAIRSQVNSLCDEIRPQAVHLVNAFGIPTNCIGAPIATGDRIKDPPV